MKEIDILLSKYLVGWNIFRQIFSFNAAIDFHSKKEKKEKENT